MSVSEQIVPKWIWGKNMLQNNLFRNLLI